MSLNLSMSEAAKMISVSPNRMQELCESGEVPAWREGRNWKIPIEDLKDWNSNRAKAEAERRKHEQESVQCARDGKDTA